MSKPQQLPKSLQKINTMAETLRHSMEEEASGAKAKGGKKGNGDFQNLSVNEVSYGNLQELYKDLLEQYRKACEDKEEISATAQRRQDAYLRKELKYREQLGQLEERINNINVEDPRGDTRMSHIRKMHGEIQDTIGMIQTKTSQILQDQERDLIRAFRARLADVTDELEKERKKNESGSVEWVQRCRKLTEELEWLRDLTDKLTAENKNYLKENRRFKRQLKTQEEDREFLIKQLVAVKKENARLRFSFEQAGVGGGAKQAVDEEKPGSAAKKQGRRGSSMSQTQPLGGPSSRNGRMPKLGGGRPSSAGGDNNMFGATTGSFPGVDDSQKRRYEAVLAKSKRRSDDLETKLRVVKTAFTNEVGQRTELQNFLKKCIEDVKQDIAQRTKKRRGGSRGGGRMGRGGRASMPKKPPVDPRDIPLNEFTSVDRINVMEWLLSQDVVMFMLFDKMFPRKQANQGQFVDGMDYNTMGMSSPSDFDISGAVGGKGVGHGLGRPGSRTGSERNLGNMDNNDTDLRVELGMEPSY